MVLTSNFIKIFPLCWAIECKLAQLPLVLMMMMAFPQLRPRIVSLGSGKIALCMLLPLLRDKAKKKKKTKKNGEKLKQKAAKEQPENAAARK